MKVYVIAHKKFDMPQADYLVPMQVGAFGKEKLGYLTDDEGDNISAKNPNYCELTGIYQIWKNRPEDIVGVCHYRRYFCDEAGKLLTKEDILEKLSKADVLTSEFTTSKSTMEQEYVSTHEEKDYNILKQVIHELHPDYDKDFEEVMNGYGMYIGNMMICRFELFEKYCEFLFSILFEVEKRVDLTGYNDYQKRIFGFMAERLMTIWFHHHKEYQVKQCKIGIVGEKSEKVELIAKVNECLKNNETEEALSYYNHLMETRPDVVNDMVGIDMQVIMIGHILKLIKKEKQESLRTDELALNYDKLAFARQGGTIEELLTHYTNIYGLLHNVADGENLDLFLAYAKMRDISATAISYIIKFGSFPKQVINPLKERVAAIFEQAGMSIRARQMLETIEGR